MSESRQQPKVLLHRPKKSQRSLPGISLPMDPPAASYSKDTGGSNGTSKVGSLGTASTQVPKQPIWYRFRTALTTLLVLNAVVVGYTLFRTSSKPSEDSNEPQSATETATEEKEKDARPEKEEENENFEPTVVLPEPSKLILTTSPTVTAKEVLKPKFSPEEQQDVFKWMLAERRKVRPRNEAEKVQLDAEKTLLKEYIRKKSVLIA